MRHLSTIFLAFAVLCPVAIAAEDCLEQRQAFEKADENVAAAISSREQASATLAEASAQVAAAEAALATAQQTELAAKAAYDKADAAVGETTQAATSAYVEWVNCIR